MVVSAKRLDAGALFDPRAAREYAAGASGGGALAATHIAGVAPPPERPTWARLLNRMLADEAQVSERGATRENDVYRVRIAGVLFITGT